MDTPYDYKTTANMGQRSLANTGGTSWLLRLQKLLGILGGQPKPYMDMVDKGIDVSEMPPPTPPPTKSPSTLDLLGGELFKGGIQGPVSGRHYGPGPVPLGGRRSGGGSGEGGGGGGGVGEDPILTLPKSSPQVPPAPPNYMTRKDLQDKADMGGLITDQDILSLDPNEQFNVGEPETIGTVPGPGGVRLIPGPLTQPPPVEAPGAPVTSTPFRGDAVHMKGQSQSMAPRDPVPTPRPSMGEPPPSPSSMRTPKVGGLILGKNKDIIPEKPSGPDPFKGAAAPPDYLLRDGGDFQLLDDDEAADSLRSVVEGNTTAGAGAAKEPTKPSPKKLTAQPPVEAPVPEVDTMPLDRYGVELPENPNKEPEPVDLDVPEPTARELYSQHIKGMPRAENFKVSKWERLAAALAGGLTGLRDPRLGVQVARNFVNRKYDQAAQEWESKGKGIKEQADIETNEETLNLRDKQIEVGYAEHLDKLQQKQQELAFDERKLREQIQIEKDKIKSGERRTDVLEQHYADLRNIQTRANELRGEEVQIKKGLAEIRKKTGESYSKLADARVKNYEQGPKGKNPRLSPRQQTDIELDAVDKAVADNPEWSRYIIPDGQPGAGRINMKKNPPPELINAAKKYMDEYRKGALGQFDVEAPPSLLEDEDQ